jgi:hypothetical protein
VRCKTAQAHQIKEEAAQYKNLEKATNTKFSFEN